MFAPSVVLTLTKSIDSMELDSTDPEAILDIKVVAKTTSISSKNTSTAEEDIRQSFIG